MKLRFFLGVMLMLLNLALSSAVLKAEQSNYLDAEVFMKLSDAQKKWGAKEFSSKGFREGNVKVRSQMAVSLIKGKTFVGKRPDEVKEALGIFSGHFWSHAVPTYLIEEGWNQNSDSWQLVFLLDDKGKVSDVKIHKNCCER